MKLPDIYRTMVITLSDRASSGEYEDLSGPAIAERVSGQMEMTGWKSHVEIKIIPDDSNMLSQLIIESAGSFNLIITTGGTGIGPRDITVDTLKPMLKFEIPGIMEMIRVKYGKEKPNALLSRGIAGVVGNALIFTLPGSVRAVGEYLDVILPLLEHTVYMQYGIDIHGKPGK
ncbi:MAG: molybdopterin-binding protein [Bacteroidales bacterium]